MIVDALIQAAKLATFITRGLAAKREAAIQEKFQKLVTKKVGPGAVDAFKAYAKEEVVYVVPLTRAEVAERMSTPEGRDMLANCAIRNAWRV